MLLFKTQVCRSDHADDEDAADTEAESDADGEDEEEEEGSAEEGVGGGGRRQRRKHRGSRRAEPEIQQINKRTSRSVRQTDEKLDGPEELPNLKPMMELEAGKNVWYQAYVLKESLNEAKVRFPRE